MSDPLGINQVDNELRTKIAAKSGSDNRAGNALANGNVGEGQYKVDASAKQELQTPTTETTQESDRQKKEDVLELTRKQYSESLKLNLTIEHIYAIINKEYGYSKDALLNLDMTEFAAVVHKLEDEYFENYLSKIIDNSNGIEEATQIINTALETDGTVKDASEYAEHFGGQNSLLNIIKQETGKEFKSISEINDNELSDIIKTLVNKYISDSSEVSNSTKMVFIKNLLKAIEDVAPEDYTRLYNAFIQNASKADAKLGLALDLIKKFKEDPKSFANFLKSDQFKRFCEENNWNYQQLLTMFNSIAEQLTKQGANTLDGLKALEEIFNKDNTYNSLLKRQQNGEELTKEQKEFLAIYPKIKAIEDKKAKGEELTEEEQQLLDKFNENETGKISDFCKSAAQLIGTKYGGDINKFIDAYKDKPELLAQALAEYQKFDPNFKIDIDYINSVTDGKFSKLFDEYCAKINTSNDLNTSETSNVSENTSIGIGYTTSSEDTYNIAVNNVANLTSQLYVPEEEGITVESTPAKSQNKKNQPEVSQKTAASNGKFFDEAWSQGVIDIKYLAENFNTACAKGIQKVWNFLDRNQQNRIDFLKSWHNSELSSKAATRYDMDKDEIEELGLSIGETQVLKNRYDQLHQNEERLS